MSGHCWDEIKCFLLELGLNSPWRALSDPESRCESGPAARWLHVSTFLQLVFLLWQIPESIPNPQERWNFMKILVTFAKQEIWTLEFNKEKFEAYTKGFQVICDDIKKNIQMHGVFFFFQHSVPPGDKNATHIHPWRLRQVRVHRVVATQTDYSVSWDIVYVAAASLEEDHESPCSSFFHLIRHHINKQCWMGEKAFQVNDFNTVGIA